MISMHIIQQSVRSGVDLELGPDQTKEARSRFMTGEGRFNWILFCEHIEKARSVCLTLHVPDRGGMKEAELAEIRKAAARSW